MHSTIPFTLLSLLPLALTKDIPVTVGANAALRFDPENVKADIGDTLTFSYFPKNHSVIQSDFANPCQPQAGGFNSGFQPVAVGPGSTQFVVTVQDTKPIWVYCAQTTGGHCQKGMKMVVNEPAPPSPNTLAAYKAAAAAGGNSTSSPFIGGGVFVNINATSTASATVSGGAASPTGSGSGSGNGGSSTNGGSGGSNPVAFQGAGVRMSSGLSVVIGAAGAAVFAML